MAEPRVTAYQKDDEGYECLECGWRVSLEDIVLEVVSPNILVDHGNTHRAQSLIVYGSTEPVEVDIIEV